MKTCVVCDHLKTITNQIWSSEYWVVILAPDQGYLGRCYVTLKAHKGSLAELSPQEWADFGQIATVLEQSVAGAFNASPVNWACMMNNAYQHQSANPHVHWHVRPRHKQPRTVNGVLFEDPLYGYHYDRDQRNFVSDDTFADILESIKRAYAAVSLSE